MKARGFLALAILGMVAWWAASLPAADRYMSIDEVRPGMVGIGRTVFEGSKIEEFKVHILGVMRNVVGPKRNLILAKLEGGRLAETGVIAGMSGSPVYIDGRMVGAVSYAMGQFSKEPIAGITPIAEMREVASLPAKRPAVQAVRLQVPITRDGLASALRTAFSWLRPFADRPGEVRMVGPGAGLPFGGTAVATQLSPIATPLVMSGFDPSVANTVAGAFSDVGFVPMSSGSAGQTPQEQAAAPLQPGDAVGVNLVGGDLALGATGTVTEVDGNQVYAFGHPFYNLGPTEFPMTRAYVFTLLPSLSSSSKVSMTGETIGTFQQDRSTAIAGVLGKQPRTIPVNLTLETERGLKKQFHYDVVNDQTFTPMLAYVSILNTLSSYERDFGALTYTLKGKASVKKHDAVAFEDVFAGDQPSVGAATYVAAPITFLLANDFEPVEIEAVDLTIKTNDQPRTAKVERVWLDAVRTRAGDTVPLKILLRTYRGEEVVRTVPVTIPANASGSLSILVSDGSRLAQWEQRELQKPLEPRGISQMIRELNNAHRNNRIYVRLLASDPGGVVSGEYLSALPPSVLAVFEGDRNGGSFIPLRSATLGEWDIQTDYAVSGTRQLTINVESSQ
jgi:hypothetical protein